MDTYGKIIELQWEIDELRVKQMRPDLLKDAETELLTLLQSLGLTSEDYDKILAMEEELSVLRQIDQSPDLIREAEERLRHLLSSKNLLSEAA